MQWLKKFFELNYSGVVDDYQSVERRNKGKGVSLFKPAATAGAAGAGAGGSRSRPGSRAAGAASARVKKVEPKTTVGGASSRGSKTAAGVAAGAARIAAVAEKENNRGSGAPRVRSSGSSRASAGASSTTSKSGPRHRNDSGMSTVTNAQAALDAEELQRIKHQLKEVTDKLTEANNDKEQLREEVNNVTQERDFYFGKLREVEVVLEVSCDHLVVGSCLQS
jgi:hypothetical protein